MEYLKVEKWGIKIDNRYILYENNLLMPTSTFNIEN
jgi:hypothetical protein